MYGWMQVMRQRELESKRREDELVAQVRHEGSSMLAAWHMTMLCGHAPPQLRQMEREAGVKARAIEKIETQDRTIREQVGG